MNKWMMVLQGVIVCGLLGIVLVIGYGQRDKDYIKYTSELKAASKKYMLNKKINPKINETIVIFVSDLIDGAAVSEDAPLTLKYTSENEDVLVFVYVFPTLSVRTSSANL